VHGSIGGEHQPPHLRPLWPFREVGSQPLSSTQERRRGHRPSPPKKPSSDQISPSFDISLADAPSSRFTGRRPKKRTLEDYFDTKAAKKVTCSLQTASDLLSLPEEILKKSVFPFLTVSNLTDFGETSQVACDLVDSFRGPLPYIVGEEVSPVYILVDVGGVGDRIGVVPVNRDYCHLIYQARKFRFRVKTRNHGEVFVIMTLRNYICSENYYREETRGFVLPDDETEVEATMMRDIKYKDGSSELKTFFEIFQDTSNDCPDYKLDGYEQFIEPDDDCSDYEDELAMPLQMEQTFRDCLEYHCICAKRIASLPTIYRFPSMEYFVKTLPDELHRFLPSSYSHYLSTGKQIVSQAFQCSWLYRPPDCPKEWEEFISEEEIVRRRLDGYGEVVLGFLDFPWLRRRYPKKPLDVNPKKLLGSLPFDVLLRDILPHLEDQDTLALASSWPDLLPELTRCARGFHGIKE
jgi:hypothetical protein